MSSLLHTDAYKFSMAEAGWPLRRETFTFSFRRGGPHFLPFDVGEVVRSLRPSTDALDVDLRYLDSVGYTMGGGFRAALDGAIEVAAIPKGSWFFDREPVFTLTGPSALVSWLEPQLIQLHYRIQLATLARLAPEQLPATVKRVTCEAQRHIVAETLDSAGVATPEMTIDPEGYVARVGERVRELVEIVGDPSRVFEVGLRSVTCLEQHMLALEACRAEGVTRTSHVAAARNLGLRPVGSMGHEHVQRYGSDEAAFRAILERRVGLSSFVLDTFSTLDSGIPAAYALMSEDPSRKAAIRYDSGDKEGQYLYATARARELGLTPRHVLEDAFDATLTRRFEALRAFTGVAPEDQTYGIGGHIVRPADAPLPRDRVAAVYKLSQSGPKPTMKFADTSGRGKESLPGRPVLHRVFDSGRWTGLVAQEGEEVEGPQTERLTSLAELPRRLRFTAAEVRGFARPQPRLSPGTKAIIATLEAARKQVVR